jgi:hypothetical protein
MASCRMHILRVVRNFLTVLKLQATSNKPQAGHNRLLDCRQNRKVKHDTTSTINKRREETGDMRRTASQDVQDIADGISSPEMITDEETGEKRQETAGDWMEDVYDIRYIVDREKRYLGAELMVAGGGPNIWVNLDTKYVEGYWGGDKVLEPFRDELDLDGYCEEMYGCS